MFPVLCDFLDCVWSIIVVYSDCVVCEIYIQYNVVFPENLLHNIFSCMKYDYRQGLCYYLDLLHVYPCNSYLQVTKMLLPIHTFCHSLQHRLHSSDLAVSSLVSWYQLPSVALYCLPSSRFLNSP